MKFDAGQRKVYILALMIIIVAIALMCVWMLWLKDDEPAQASGGPEISPTTPIEYITPQVTSGAAADEDVSAKVNTIVYYQDNYGYLVPVMCAVPYEDGIAKATLEMMVKSGPNDMQAARMGLRTVIPENVTMELDISGGKARIDLKYDGDLEFADAAAENNMVMAIVQTLTEFDTVETVEFLFNGQKLEKLPFGTDVSEPFSRGDINLESTAAPTGASADANALTLYFPGESASVVVPVTRMVYSAADIDTAVLEMTRGPMSDALEEAIPDGCGLIGVEVEDGVAKVNFTKEFMQIVNNIDGGRLALKALVVTCTQFDGVDSVEIYVEGEKWDTGAGTLAAPSFSNVAGDIEYDYIQTQANLIFED